LTHTAFGVENGYISQLIEPLRGNHPLIQSFVRIAAIFLFMYAALLGAHFRGILIPQVHLVTLLLLAGVVIVWWTVRTRAGWRWQRTALDAALPLWLLAFGLSLLFNLDAGRRIITGMWYMGIYIGLWYMLHDVLANRGLSRRTVVDAILFTGMLVLAFSVVEWQIGVRASGVSLLEYRLRGVLGNPNPLGTFLAVLLLLILGRLTALRSSAGRMMMGAYLLACALLLLLTFSRSAWLGAGAGLAVWAGLWLVQHGMMSRAAVMAWWQRQSAGRRAAVAGAGLGAVLVSGAAAVIFGLSFLGDGRGLSFRPELFRVAGEMFADNPLAGRGLYTFGRHMSRLLSQPPLAVHSHAHNLLVNIAGELGAAGLAAALVTLVLLLRAMWRTGQAASGTQRAEWRGAAAAVVAFGVIHLMDVTAMLPGLAITGILILLLAVVPQQLDAVTTPRGRRLRSVGLAGLWLALIGSGLWDGQLYSRYTAVLAGALEDEYAATAADLQAVVATDPAHAVYTAQQGLLWGVAAQAGDVDARQRAMAAYERAAQLEPYYAPYVANLAALYWSAGEPQRAITTMQQATALAPDSWQLHYNVGLYAEQQGQEELAREAYTRALNADPDADLYPDWGQSPLRTGLRSEFADRSAMARVALLIEAGRFDEADALVEAERVTILPGRHHVLRELLALAQHDRDTAAFWLDRAERAPTASDLWRLLGELRLAQFDDDPVQVQDTLARIRAAQEYHLLTRDYGAGPDIAAYQFLRQGLLRQFVPQVFYPANEVILLYLLDNS
jgi:tetratricopeptide (TPR) repeat protein